MSKFSIFTIANDLSFDKKDRFEEGSHLYNQFMINRYFSQFNDTVLIANEMNIRDGIPDMAHHDFYMNMVRKRKRFTKWAKKTSDNKSINNIMEYYDVSFKKANQIVKLLTDDQKKLIEKELTTGGKK